MPERETLGLSRSLLKLYRIITRCLEKRPKTRKGGTKVDQGRTKKVEVDWRRGIKRTVCM